jgi:isopentenyl-diphosphate delta-isomerase
VRERAPSAVVLANLGACQLLEQGDRPALRADQVAGAIEMVGADILTVHLNVAQEVVQTEGDRTTGPFLPALEALVARSPVPVMVKETGGGMTGHDARRLAEAGVAALDVGGAGGTSFVAIEGARAGRSGDERGIRLGTTFSGWGVPTAAAVLEVARAGLPVVATGGVRHGLDAARALALGATAVGLGRVAATAARGGAEACTAELALVVEELRIATLLCGAARSADLGRAGAVIEGPTLAWARQRGLPLPGGSR